MSNVVDIMENQPHKTIQVMCQECFDVWQAVYPASIDTLQCKCGCEVPAERSPEQVHSLALAVLARIAAPEPEDTDRSLVTLADQYLSHVDY